MHRRRFLQNIDRRQAVLLLVAAALLWSTGGVMVKLIPAPPMAIAGMRSAIAAATIVAVTGKKPVFTWSLNQVVGSLAYAGTVTTAFYSTAIKHVTALTAAVITLIEPLFNPVWVFLLVGEAPGPLSLAGGLLVLSAVTLYSVLGPGKKSPKAELQNQPG